jgi:DNA polymerase-3 subunit epsilon
MDAAEALTAADSAVPQDLVFVDLETTGGNAAYHRITEVGIVRMVGGSVVEEWSSLVNPECRIPPYIEAFTGITNAMVADAPRFADIAPLVRDKLCSPVFAAHNARFDYSFLRSEFRRLDMSFSAKVMCTVKLSRRLFPEHRRHSLDAVMERHGLSCSARHRALGDARVLGEFWSQLLRKLPAAELAAAAQLVIGSRRLPAHLPPELIDELPEGPGVYRLYGEDDVLLYIGKSHSLRARVLADFVCEHSAVMGQKKARLTRRIDWLETAGELGAELWHSQWIKSQKPLFNKRTTAEADSFTLRAGSGTSVQLAAVGALDPASLAECYGIFHSPRDARRALVDIARAHSLCLKVLRVEQGAGSCLAYPLGKCRGACVGKEPPLLHATRLRMALSALKLKSWPFPGRIALKEGRSEYHVLDGWAFVGTAHSEEQLSELQGVPAATAFDSDVYKILVRYLTRHPGADWLDLRDKSPRAAVN